jgi:hypothetical protein
MNARMCQVVVAVTLLLTAHAAEPQTHGSPNSPATPLTPAVDTGTATSIGNVSNAVTTNAPITNHAVPEPTVTEPMPAVTNAAPRTVVRAPAMSLSPLLDQVVRMSERGTDETVLKAYIDSSPAYRITGNEIIQMQDLGVSQSIILALVQRSKETTMDPATPAVDAAATAAVVPAAPSNEVGTTIVEPPAAPPTDYYDALAPYGTWYDVPGYGYSWQPTVAVINASWRPYSDYGNWLWSDYGWYWNSYYSWGWAPFHYGRWYSHPHRGWLWCPDYTWGPAWVSWRYHGGYCGWAPLPPGAHFAVGIGWTHHGHHVGHHHDFGLHHRDYTFVHKDHFGSRHVAHNALAGADSRRIYDGSTVNNNHTIRGNRIVNTGVARNSVSANAPVRQVATPAVSPRGMQPAARANVGRGTIAGTAQPAVASAAFTRPAVTGSGLQAAPAASAGGNGFPRIAPSANSFARRTTPIQPAIRQPSAVQSMSRQAAPRTPQTVARVAPNVQRFGSRAAPMRSAPSMPRYSAPAGGARSFAANSGRANLGRQSIGASARGTVAPRGSVAGGGGRIGGGGQRGGVRR